MRNVAVTDGDKIEAEQKFGWTVDAWPVNELVPYVDAVTPAEIAALTDEYYDTYDLVLDGRDADEFRRHVEVQAQQEIGIERFLVEHGYNAFSDHFGDLGMPEAASVPGHPAPHAEGLRFRSRGRLEDPCDGAPHEGHDRR